MPPKEIDTPFKEAATTTQDVLLLGVAISVGRGFLRKRSKKGRRS